MEVSTGPLDGAQPAAGAMGCQDDVLAEGSSGRSALGHFILNLGNISHYLGHFRERGTRGL